MPSQGKAAWNKEYYKKNADDILYRAKQERKVAKRIPCPCKEYGYYKDTKACKRVHFKTQVHQLYERKMRCVKILTNDFNYPQHKAEKRVDREIQKKCGLEYVGKVALKNLTNFEYELRDTYIKHLENENKPKPPVDKNIVLEKTELESQPLQQPVANPLVLLPVTAKNAIIPEYDGQGFDPMGLIRPLGWENDVPEKELERADNRLRSAEEVANDPNMSAFNNMGLE
tara:strand:+ start:176 stop:859 length:684 start_codon:yes stop_codon:yes gene_type:complete